MSLHILHLEDDKELREVFIEVIALIDPSVVVQQFVSADDALAYIQQHGQNIDLFVLDIRVPGQLSGLALAGKIRELGYQVRIVVTSAYQRPAQAELDTLQIEYVTKPWAVPEFFRYLLRLSD